MTAMLHLGRRESWRLVEDWPQVNQSVGREKQATLVSDFIPSVCLFDMIGQAFENGHTISIWE